jgi:hypothetical protein
MQVNKNKIHIKLTFLVNIRNFLSTLNAMVSAHTKRHLKPQRNKIYSTETIKKKSLK